MHSGQHQVSANRELRFGSGGTGFALHDDSAQGGNGTAGRAGGMSNTDQLALAENEYGQKFRAAPGTADTVALATLDQYNPISVSQNREYAGLMYERGGAVGVTPGAPGQPCTSSGCSSQPFLMKSAVPSGARILAYWHTHGAASGGFTYDFFSEADVNLANYVGNIYGGSGGYVGTPAGNAYFIGANALNPTNYSANQLYPAIIRTQRFVGHVDVW